MSGNSKNLKKLVVGLALVGLAGCGSGKNDGAVPSAPSAPFMGPSQLVQSDLAHFRSTEHDGFLAYDRETAGADNTPGLFSKVFGGTSLSDVTNYLDARLKHYVDPEDPSIEVVAQTSGNGPLGETEKKGTIGAVNIGAAIWLQSQVVKTPARFRYQGQNIDIDSTRVGIMLIGEGYEEETRDSRGGKIPLPPEYREAILVHEARHSDCTGGLKQSALAEIRKAANRAEMNSKMGGLSCGHTHVNCPVGHPLEGLAACDNEAWGAYSIGGVFYRAVSRDSKISALDYNIAAAVVADTESRVLVDRNGDPDMSTGGVIQ